VSQGSPSGKHGGRAVREDDGDQRVAQFHRAMPGERLPVLARARTRQAARRLKPMTRSQATASMASLVAWQGCRSSSPSMVSSVQWSPSRYPVQADQGELLVGAENVFRHSRLSLHSFHVDESRALFELGGTEVPRPVHRSPLAPPVQKASGRDGQGQPAAFGRIRQPCLLEVDAHLIEHLELLLALQSQFQRPCSISARLAVLAPSRCAFWSTSVSAASNRKRP
jgi:hypothetical protein